MENITSILESVDTVVIIALTTTSVILSVTGFGLIVVLISTVIAPVLSVFNKVLHKIIINIYIK